MHLLSSIIRYNCKLINIKFFSTHSPNKEYQAGWFLFCEHFMAQLPPMLHPYSLNGLSCLQLRITRRVQIESCFADLCVTHEITEIKIIILHFLIKILYNGINGIHGYMDKTNLLKQSETFYVALSSYLKP